MRHLRGQIELKIIDEVRHAVLIDYWGRVGFVSFDGGLYSISYDGKNHSGLTIDEAFSLMKKTISSKNGSANLDGR